MPHMSRYVKALVLTQRRPQASCLCTSMWAHQLVPPSLGQALGPGSCIGGGLVEVGLGCMHREFCSLGYPQHDLEGK